MASECEVKEGDDVGEQSHSRRQLIQPETQQQAPTLAQKITVRNSDRVHQFLRIFRPGRRPPRTLLDLGCGNAEITVELAAALRIPLSSVHGADMFPENEFRHPGTDKDSPPSFARTTKRIHYHALVDGYKLPQIASGSVDLVVCYMSIHHFSDFDRMMNEVCRVLRNRGWMFFREHDVPDSDHALKEYLDDVHLRFPDHAGSCRYWSRPNLRQRLEREYGFRHLANGEYPNKERNRQAIYHSLFLKV